MKTQLFALLLLVLCHVQGQSPSEEAIKSTIEDFFEGFHKRDTSQMRSVLSEHLTMQRIGKDADAGGAAGRRQQCGEEQAGKQGRNSFQAHAII